MSRTYPYNSMLLPMLKYTLNRGSEGTVKSRGFIPYYGSDVIEIVRIERESIALRDETVPAVNPFYAGLLRDFVMSARERNVKVFVCTGPLWEQGEQEAARRKSLIDAYSRLLEQLEVPLIRIDDSTDEIFQNPDVYKDRIHLNDRGAQEFSTILGERLRGYLKHPETQPMSGLGAD